MQDLIYQDESISLEDFLNRTINEVLPKEDGLKVEIHRNELAFELLERDWKQLTQKAGSTIYMSQEWAKAWWSFYGRKRGRSLFFVSLWYDSEMVALAPFYREVSQIGSRVIESRMRLIGSGGSQSVRIGFKDDYGISDFLDVIVDPNFAEPVADKLIQIIESSYFDADHLSFDQARQDSFVMNELYPRLKGGLLPVELTHTDTCPYIDLSEVNSLKEYIKGLKSNARRRFRQTLRAVGSDEEFVYVEPQSWEEVQEATETIIKLHQDRWNELGFPGVFYEQRFAQFFRVIVHQAYENKWLWFKEAKDDLGVCAARMIIFYNGRYFDYISGFDDNRESARRRPGIGLLIDLVEDAIEAGVTRVELLRGEEGYKYDFTDKNFKNWKVSIQLREGSTVSQRMLRKVLHGWATVYKYSKSETRLMNVQRLTKGALSMIPGYLSFRWKSIKLKFQ